MVTDCKTGEAVAIGDRVRCFVTVDSELIPMHTAIVTGVRDGYCMANRMGLHGGAPWVCSEILVAKEPQHE